MEHWVIEWRSNWVTEQLRGGGVGLHNKGVVMQLHGLRYKKEICALKGENGLFRWVTMNSQSIRGILAQRLHMEIIKVLHTSFFSGSACSVLLLWAGGKCALHFCSCVLY